jgi:CBS domain-containing protein
MNLVRHILDDARKRLVILDREALLSEAAAALVNPGTPLVVVCDRKGIAIGVVSKTDVMKALAGGSRDGVWPNVGNIMTRPIFSCHLEQTLAHVWEIVNARALRAVPILDDSGRPLGVVHARDLARALLDEVDEEEVLLRDYVLGVGYQ